MTDIYSLPNATHYEKGVQGLFDYANSASDGIFVPMFMLALWLITFIGSITGIKMNPSSAWIFASFLLAVVSVPLAIIKLLNPKFIYLPIVLLCVGVIWSYLENAEWK